MNYLTIGALLLPATVLAKPVAVVRQPTQRARFTGGFRTQGECGIAIVDFNEVNEIATVSLWDYNVGLPSTDIDKACSITLTVQFPADRCTTGVALGTVSGQVSLPAGVQAMFNSRDYTVSPGGVSQVSDNKQWTGPVNESYTLNDLVWYTYDRPDSNNQNVNFTLQGQLLLQPSNGPSGFLSNGEFVLDIGTQIPCCKCQALLLRKLWL